MFPLPLLWSVSHARIEKIDLFLLKAFDWDSFSWSIKLCLPVCSLALYSCKFSLNLFVTNIRSILMTFRTLKYFSPILVNPIETKRVEAIFATLSCILKNKSCCRKECAIWQKKIGVLWHSKWFLKHWQRWDHLLNCLPYKNSYKQ